MLAFEEIPQYALSFILCLFDSAGKWGVPGFCSGSSVAASKILCAKTGQEAYLGLILIHTKFEKKT